MPSGALAGAGAVFGIVRVKPFVGGGGVGVEAATIGLAFGKCVDEDFHTAMPPTKTRTVAAKPQGARFGGTICGGLMTLSFLDILSGNVKR